MNVVIAIDSFKGSMTSLDFFGGQALQIVFRIFCDNSAIACVTAPEISG